MHVVRCPAEPEEMAEAYCNNELSEQAAEVFEAHYIGCSACAETVFQTGIYVAAMKAAARQIRCSGGTRGTECKPES
jgi:hypothetical protein